MKPGDDTHDSKFISVFGGVNRRINMELRYINVRLEESTNGAVRNPAYRGARHLVYRSIDAMTRTKGL